MELLEGIASRKSIRGFTSKPVSKETLNRVLEAAGRSPSFTNSQPWEAAVVSGKKKEELSQILYKMAESNTAGAGEIPNPREWPPALDKRTKEHGARRFQALGIDRANDEQRKELRLANYLFYGAPSAMFVFIDKGLSPWSLFDAGLFSQSVCLAAQGLGLGTCLQASACSYPDAVRNYLGMPNNKMLVIAIAIGYPDPAAKLNAYQATRMGTGDFVKWYD